MYLVIYVCNKKQTSKYRYKNKSKSIYDIAIKL